MLLVEAWGLALGTVLIMSSAIIGFGCALKQKYGFSLLTALVLGLGTFCTLSEVTGMAGFYSVIPQTLLVVLGLSLLGRYHAVLHIEKSPPMWRRDFIWLVIPAIYFLTRFFSCGLPQQHSDPLYYHLSAAKYWAELGQIRVTEVHPSYSQASLWETLYGIPQLWFGTSGLSSHIVTQLYGQWMHALWGQIGCALIASQILRKLAPKFKLELGLSLFLGWLCTSLPSWEWTGCLAKSDFVIVLFVLASLYEALEERFFIAGLLMGFAYSTKVLAAWAAISLVIWIPWRKLPHYIAGAAFAAFPFLLRNLIWTKNPFFPTLDEKVGPHWISSLWINHNLSFGGPLKVDPQMWGWLWDKLLTNALPKAMLALGVAAFLITLVSRRKVQLPAHFARWCFFILAQLAFAFLMLRPAADGRYGSYFAACAMILSMALVLRAAELAPRIVLYALLPLGLLLNSPVDELVKIPKHYLFISAEKYVEQFHPVYDVQKWANEKVPLTEKIFFTAEKQQFYLDRPFETISEMKSWEDLLAPIKSRKELFEMLHALGYRYVHFSPQTGGYPIVFRPYWNEIMAIQDRAVFHSANSLVYDLTISY